MISDLTNEETQQDFFNYLANYDISDFKHQRPPMTSMKRTMIGMSVSNVVSFMLDVCENTVSSCEYESDKVDICPTSIDMFNAYVTWCSQNDCKGRKHKKKSFIKEMGTTFGIIEVRPIIDGSKTRRFRVNRAELLPKFKDLYCKDDFEYKIA